jgi:hypothetical protein
VKKKNWFLVPFYNFLEAKFAVTFAVISAVISYQVVVLLLDNKLIITIYQEKRVNKDDGK